MSRFNFTIADALYKTRDAVLRFPLGHMLKWSLIALSVPTVFMLVMAVLCLVIGGDARAVFDREVLDLAFYALILSQIGVALFWVVKEIR